MKSAKKIAIGAILRYLWKNGLNARAETKEINNVEDPGICSTKLD